MKLFPEIQNDQDKMFVWFTAILAILAIGTGIAVVVIILAGNDHVLANRLLNIFASMFSGLLGFGTGYLLGAYKHNGNNKTAAH